MDTYRSGAWANANPLPDHVYAAAMKARPPEWRFLVSVCNARTDWPSTISHGFVSQERAEEYARVISRYLQPKLPGHPPRQWVLVGALVVDRRLQMVDGWPRTCAYMSIDPGGEVVKHHVIPAGYFGSQERSPYAP